MKRRRAAVACALLLAACGRAKSVHLDLAASAPIADRDTAYEQVIVLGTPAAEPSRGTGLLRDESAQGPRVWSRREGELLLSLSDVRPRVAVVDLEPYAGLPPQSAEVRLNEKEIATLAIEPARRRYRLALPAAAQQEGVNRLSFAFRELAPSGNPLGRRVAAALYSLVLGPEGDPRVEDLLARAAPPAFAVERSGGVPRVLQVGAGALRWAFRMPAAAELRFTPRLHPAAAAAGAHARFAVKLETLGASRELWSRELGPSDSPYEVVLPLEAPAGEPARISLELAGGGRFDWGTWQAPRILAGGAPEANPPPLALADERRADGLRAALKDTNVLLIVLDAAGAGHFGAYGYARNTTPEMDRIAKEGVVFERDYAPAVYTIAAMASIWTSQYPDEHGAGVDHGVRLTKGPLTLAELLTPRGVLTGGFIANGMAGPAFGLERGFAEFKEAFRGHGSEAECFRKELWPWLRDHKERRFFAYAHFREPHFPYDPKPPFDTMFGPDAPLPKEARSEESFIVKVNWGGRQLTPAEREHLVRLYDGNLAYADQEIGALRKHLESLGLWDKTVVIITADHGEALYEHEFVGHNQQLYEASVHVPLIVRFPVSRGPVGVRIAGLVDSRDLAPTIADVFGLRSEPAAAAFEGRSLLPVALGAPGRPFVFSRSTGDRPRYSVRDDRYKLIYTSRFGPEELYDVVADPDEMKNLIRKEPVRAAFYRQVLGRWMTGLKTRDIEVTPASALTPEQQENLQALGYVQ